MAAARWGIPPLGWLRGATLAGLLALGCVAWIATGERMAGMDGGPGTDLGTLGFFLLSWAVMMPAMMFPSITPMVLVFARIQGRRRERAAPEGFVSTWVFVAGYLIVWTTFGLLAYALFVSARALSIDALAWDRAGRYVAGGVVAAAAVYQLTPLKDACLRRCRGPFEFLTERWRDGSRGALLMGIEHGAWCVGCCWALMAALFALGVMSIGWMVTVAGLVAVEKLLPWKRLASRAVALVLLALALAVAVAPAVLPGLTVPGSADAHQDHMSPEREQRMPMDMP